MRNTSNDVFWSVMAGRYLYDDENPGCFVYSIGTIILIAVIGSIFAFIEEGIIDLFGGSWDEMVIPHILLLIVMTLSIILLEIRGLNNKMKFLEKVKSEKQDNVVNEEKNMKVSRAKNRRAYKDYFWIKLILFILSFGIGYAVVVGLDIKLFSDALYVKSEETNGTLFPWIFWILLHFLSIPIEFIIKLILVPIIQFILIKIIVIPFTK